MIYTTIALGCFAISLYYAAVCESLRNFLRSRLAAVCRLRQNEERFGIILRDDELALQAAETVRLLALTCGMLLFAYSRASAWGDLSNSSIGIWLEILTAMVLVWLGHWVFPRTLSQVAAEHVIYHLWPCIQLTIRCCAPLLWLIQSVNMLMHRMAGRQDPTPENIETLAEEIQSVVDEGEREGILESHAGKMIHRVMELRQEDVQAVMTPRTEMITIQADCSLEQARAQLLDAGHSRIPVVEGTTDNILGILYARDLLEHFGKPAEEVSLRSILREAFYVPETNTIDALLNTMKQQRLHMAIVLDEYGGVTGLVTLEDILEEIVGEIADEFDEQEDERIEWIDPCTFIVDARMHIDELNDLFDLDLPEDHDFDTIAGLVFSELERVPKSGEHFEWMSIRFTVVEATERKILRVQLYSPIPWPQNGNSLNGDSPENSTNNAPSDSTLRLVTPTSTPEERTA